MSRPLLKDKQKTYTELILILVVLLILLIAAGNIAVYFKPKKVLGISVRNTSSDTNFWNSFLKNNPDYIPGWIEQGNTSKVKEIDPNYFY